MVPRKVLCWAVFLLLLPVLAAANTVTHTVVKGDTVSHVALKWTRRAANWMTPGVIVLDRQGNEVPKEAYHTIQVGWTIQIDETLVRTQVVETSGGERLADFCAGFEQKSCVNSIAKLNNLIPTVAADEPEIAVDLAELLVPEKVNVPVSYRAKKNASHSVGSQPEPATPIQITPATPSDPVSHQATSAPNSNPVSGAPLAASEMLLDKESPPAFSAPSATVSKISTAESSSLSNPSQAAPEASVAVSNGRDAQSVVAPSPPNVAVAVQGSQGLSTGYLFFGLAFIGLVVAGGIAAYSRVGQTKTREEMVAFANILSSQIYLEADKERKRAEFWAHYQPRRKTFTLYMPAESYPSLNTHTRELSVDVRDLIQRHQAPFNLESVSYQTQTKDGFSRDWIAIILTAEARTVTRSDMEVDSANLAG